MAENKKNEFNPEQRLMLALVLMGVVFFASSYLLPKPEPPKPTPPAQSSGSQTGGTQSSTGTANASQPNAALAKPGTTQAEAAPAGSATTQVMAQAEETVEVETDLFRVKFTNRGAAVVDWILKNYKTATKKPLNLTSADFHGKVLPRPFTVHFHTDRKPSQDVNNLLYAITKSADGKSVTFTYKDGTLHSSKTFRFQDGSYVVDLTDFTEEKGTPIPQSLVWRGGFGDFQVEKPYTMMYSILMLTGESEPELKDGTAAKAGPLVVNGNYQWAGMQDAYFGAFFLPKDNQPMTVTTFTDELEYPAGGKEKQMFAGTAVSGLNRNSLKVYVGPKETEILVANDARLEPAVNWGWFGWIAKPLFSALRFLNNNYLHNWGWSIVVLTILINLALIPLKISSLKSSQKMSAIQPQLQAINDRYKGIPMTDPRNEQKNKEIMELYSKNGVNPAGGCLPLLLQFPFFIGFYKVLNSAMELRLAPWLWVDDLSQPEKLAIRLLPVLMIITQVWMMKMTPTTGMDPKQQNLMMIMQVGMFAWFFYSASSGLVLYWLTGNIVGVAQQLVFNRLVPTKAAPAKAAANNKMPVNKTPANKK